MEQPELRHVANPTTPAWKTGALNGAGVFQGLFPKSIIHHKYAEVAEFSFAFYF